jgi:hypothetical protein
MVFKYGSRARDDPNNAGEDDRPVTWQQHEAQCRSAAGRDYGALAPAGAPVAHKPASAAELQRQRQARGVRPRGAGSSFRELYPSHAARVQRQLDAWQQRRRRRQQQQHRSQQEQIGGGGGGGDAGGVATEGGSDDGVTGNTGDMGNMGTSAFASLRRMGFGGVVRSLGHAAMGGGEGGGERRMRGGGKEGRGGGAGGGGGWSSSSSWTEAPLGFPGVGAGGGGLRFAPLRHP